MSKMPRITGKQLVDALERAGFLIIRISGSHHHLHKEGKALVTVPVHSGETLSPFILKSILKQAGLSTDELLELL